MINKAQLHIYKLSLMGELWGAYCDNFEKIIGS